MQQITLKGTSKIIVGESFENIKNFLPNNNVIIITDENLNKYYSDKFPKFPIIKIGLGEQIKTFETINYIIDNLIKLNADRHSFILGIGGGIVCDIAGFVASIYMRGIKFGFVSTSLLSQVDASVGGKNGVNFNSYKNIIGNFNQPEFVICDTKLLNTLPKAEINTGMGEIIKHSLIADYKMFKFVKENYNKILNLDYNTITNLVFDNIKIKAKIVENDEKENGERKKLNFGHTLAHAIEKYSNLTHGQAVAVGIVFASYLSLKKKYISEQEFNKIKDVLLLIGLPISVNIDNNKIADAIVKDKKKNNNKIDFIYLKQIGEAKVETISINELQNEILNYEL